MPVERDTSLNQIARQRLLLSERHVDRISDENLSLLGYALIACTEAIAVELHAIAEKDILR